MANRKSNAANINKNQAGDESMTVQQAGGRGGRATAETHGREFYENIGHKGGQRVRELIQEGKQAESNANAAKPRRQDDYDQAA